MTRQTRLAVLEQSSLTSVAPHRDRSALVTELLGVMRNPASSVAQLGAIVSSDRGLSERVLRIANSPSLGIPARVETVPHAVTMLGFDALRDTVMRMVVTGAFRTIVDLFTQYGEFWNHSIACGLVARVLARKYPPVHENDAFVAGLFHDIGMISPAEQREGHIRWNLAPEDPQTVVEHHGEIGSWLAEQWGLGDRIVEAVRYHHHPANAVYDPYLVATVHIADILCRRMDVGRYEADAEQAYDQTALTLLGLTEDDLTPPRLQDDTIRIQEGMAEAPAFDRLVAALKQSLVEAIGALPYKERLTLALCYQEGLAIGEVAHLMGTTEEDVYRLHDVALSTLAATIHDCL